MPEQNTNRLWFALGAIIIGAMLFFTYRDSAEGTVKKIFEGFNVGIIDAIDKDTTSPGGSDTDDPDNTYTYYKIRDALDSSSEVWVRTEMLDNGHVRIVDAGAKDKFKDNTYGSGLTGKISFPDTVGDGLVIETISVNAMKNAKFEDVMRLPEELLVLDDYALQQSHFSGEAVFPHALEKIGVEALRDSKFTGAINLPDSLKIIGDNALANSDFKEALVLPDSMSVIGDAAFSNSHFTGTISLPHDVSSIGHNAFEHSEFIGTLDLPSSVTYIGDSSFANSKFSGPIELPKSVGYIGDNAFSESKFTGSLSIPSTVESIGNNSFKHSIFDGTFVSSTSLTKIGSEAFANSNFSSIDLSASDKLEIIDDSAFELSALTGLLLLPDSVVRIGDKAFMNAVFTNTDLKLPKMLEYVGASALYKSKFMGNFTMGDNLKYIGSNAFSYTGSSNEMVTSITETKSAITTRSDVSSTLVLSKALEYVGDGAFMYSKFSGTFDMPSNLTYIGNDAFYSAYSGISTYKFKSDNSTMLMAHNYMTMNQSIDIIGDRAFYSAKFNTYKFTYYASDTSNTLLPKSLTSIGQQAFANSLIDTVLSTTSSTKYYKAYAYSTTSISGSSFPGGYKTINK